MNTDQKYWLISWIKTIGGIFLLWCGIMALMVYVNEYHAIVKFQYDNALLLFILVTGMLLGCGLYYMKISYPSQSFTKGITE